MTARGLAADVRRGWHLALNSVMWGAWIWCASIQPVEAWPALLAGHLGKSVCNLGVPGIGAYEYLVLLRRFGLVKRPRVVVMNLYEGNDLRDALRYWRHRKQIAATSEGRKLGASSATLVRKNYAYNLLARPGPLFRSVGDLRPLGLHGL